MLRSPLRCGEGAAIAGVGSNKGLHPYVISGHIDRLVYELYGLTEEEIKNVEGTG
jgi:hypothetical protein